MSTDKLAVLYGLNKPNHAPALENELLWTLIHRAMPSIDDDRLPSTNCVVVASKHSNRNRSVPENCASVHKPPHLEKLLVHYKDVLEDPNIILQPMLNSFHLYWSASSKVAVLHRVIAGPMY
jgi:hypothetical protein